MTNKQAKDFMARFPGARDFTKPSHFELPDLLEVHVDAIVITREDFHQLAGGVLYPKKETIDKFGISAGVSYNTMIESTRKDGAAFVGRSQGMTMGPDGQAVMGDVCEYEFDPELRAEEDFIKNADKYSSTGAKRLKVLEYTKMGRQRANTGARSRATLSVLGIQTGFKDLFQDGKSEEVFLFSRVMINTKNQLMAKALIENVSGNSRSLFGPPRTQSIAAPEPRNVTGSGDEFGQDEDDFGPEPTPEAMRAATLQDLITKYGSMMKPTGVSRAEAAISQRNDQEVQTCLSGIKAFLEGQGISFGGAA